MVIFSVLVYFSIIYLSNSRSQINIPAPDILGTTVKYLPPQSQTTLKNLNTSPAFVYIQGKINYLKGQTNGFPQKQITDIKKMVVEKIYQNVMNSLEPKK